MNNKRYLIIAAMTAILFACSLYGIPVKASAVTAPQNPAINTGEIPITIQEEPQTSDLTLLHAETVLDSDRWIQSFTKDANYYYFVQMTNPYQGHLRITRVKYTTPHQYTKDHMDLLGFGHGTNIDCTTYRGKTYLWTGSCVNKKNMQTTAISCFSYVPGGVFSRKAGKTFKIRMKGRLKKAENVFPAVSQDQKYLYVRYTYKKQQYFQKYRIYNGNAIKSGRILSKVALPRTAGDFQGFDVYKNYIYTIEGSPTALFLSTYDPHRFFQSTIIRITNMKTKSKRIRIITGAKGVAFREPEGIDISKKKRIEILFATNTLTKQRCSVYKLK